jgi:hypothetical protein
MRKTDTTYVVVTEHRCLCISFFRSWHWRSIYSNLTSQIPKCQRHLWHHKCCLWPVLLITCIHM